MAAGADQPEVARGLHIFPHVRGSPQPAAGAASAPSRFGPADCVNAARVDAELHLHPVVVALERPERVHVLCTEHVDEELVRLLEVWNGDAEVVGAAHSRQWHGRVLAFRSFAFRSRCADGDARPVYWIQYHPECGGLRAGSKRSVEIGCNAA